MNFTGLRRFKSSHNSVFIETFTVKERDSGDLSLVQAIKITLSGSIEGRYTNREVPTNTEDGILKLLDY